MSSKHTPGPWRVRPERESPKDGDLGIYAEASDGAQRGIALVGISEFDRDEDAANAALIASAPTLAAQVARLREALAEVTNDLENAYDDGQGARPTAVSAAIHRARSALAVKKSKGERVSRFAPFGYEYRDGKAVPVAKEQATLARYRELLASGLTRGRALRRLRAEGHTNRVGKPVGRDTLAGVA